MIRPLPSLNALRAFEVTARLGSMSRAAEELHVTPGAVSQQIRELERDLGVLLFDRKVRHIILTDAGVQFSTALRSAFRIIRDATSQVRASDHGGILTISCTSGFASQWLLPRLSAFEEMQPETDIRISASNRILDFQRDNIDIGVRHGLGQWPGLISEKLIDDELTPICSPEYMVANGPFNHPADLAAVTFLHDEHRYDWALWMVATGASDVDMDVGPVFVDGAGAIDAALAHQGVALVRRSMVSREIDTGRLIAPFRQAIAADLAYYLVYLPDALNRENVAAFRDWLLSEAAKGPFGPM